MIDEDAGQPGSDRPLDQRGRDCRVDSAGQAADRAAVADLLGDRGDLLVDDAAHGPGRAAARGREEMAQDLHAMLAVHDLRVELHAVEAPALILGSGHRRRAGPRRDGESRRRRGAGVAVRHPHLLAGRQAVEQHSAGGRPGADLELRGAVLAAAGALHHAAEP